jgi:small subunit ribosomal protein S3
LRGDIAKVTNSEVSLNIVEIRKPEVEAKLIAEGIAQQLERRVAFRRAMKRASNRRRGSAPRASASIVPASSAAPNRAHGMVSRGPGALAHLACRCRLRQATAKTTYGTCGVKVWVFKGEILAHDPMAQDKRLAEAQPAGHERGHDRGRRDRDRDQVG